MTHLLLIFGIFGIPSSGFMDVQAKQSTNYSGHRIHWSSPILIRLFNRLLPNGSVNLPNK